MREIFCLLEPPISVESKSGLFTIGQLGPSNHSSMFTLLFKVLFNSH